VNSDGPSGLPPESRQGRRARQRRRSSTVLAISTVLVAALAVTALVIVSPQGRSAASSPKATTTTTTVKIYVPNPVQPILRPAQPGEGRWAVRDTWHAGEPLVATTFLRTSPSATAYVSWIRSRATQLGLYLGYKGPGSTNLNRGPELVPYSGRGRLLATFNSGFYESDSTEGFYTHGTLYFPMVNNHATLVAYGDGRYDVINWTAGRRPPPGVVIARQNLHMLVNNGAPASGVNVGSNWGITLHGVPNVWRTGVGVDKRGDLIYVAASSQTAASLAQIFIHLGCVRAMQLDINPEWPIFVTYGSPGAGNPTLDVPNPNQVRSRFLYTSTKDFFAVYVRQYGKSEAPW